MNNRKCNLCEKNLANKENSHIIPKFLCKGLFEGTKPRHSIKIKNNGKGRLIQDTPKEDYILCENCEKRIGLIETYFARKIIDINNYKNLKEDFSIGNFKTQEFLICRKINPKAFKLFIYSIIWRASISSLDEFKNFKLDTRIENEINNYLNTNLKNTHSELLENFEKIKSTPEFHFCIIKPFFKSKNSRGIFTAYQNSENSFILMIVDFAIYFFKDETIMDNGFKCFSNNQNSEVIIVLAEIEKWNDLNKTIIKVMLENQP